MHRLPSHSTLSRFRIASLLVVVMFVTLPLAIGFLVYGFYFREHHWFNWAGVSLLVGGFLMIVLLIMSGKLRCPLCTMPPLQNRRCAKHRTVKRIFGSHRLKVAQSILMQDSFRCPYCGEPTAMEVRQSRRG